jgi:Ca2+-binding RTX toxin-like protein
VDGGGGTDIYDAGNSNNVVYINLDNSKHALPFGFGPPNIAAGTVMGADVAGSKADLIKGFKNVFAGTSDDIVFGSRKGNEIDAGDGADVVFGFAGNDRLFGSFGNDFLCGGAGLDILSGGTGADHFVFTSARDSHVSALRRDRIADFEDGVDLIDLVGIDAVKGSGNDAFHFIGTDVSFTGAAGELRAYHVPGGQVIEGDTDGDKIPDFSIAVDDAAKEIVFTAIDFQL